MKIDGQSIVETKDSYTFRLVLPFWSAWQRYKWKERQAGFGISYKLCNLALKKKKKIVVVYKGISYEISPVTIKNYFLGSKIEPIFKARGGVKLIVVPQSKFKATKKFDKEKYEQKETERIGKRIEKQLSLL